MSPSVLPYLLLAMIFYDFSLHLLELIMGRKRARKLKPYHPVRLFVAKGKFNRKKYTVFWTIYWGIALLLLLIYLYSANN